MTCLIFVAQLKSVDRMCWQAILEELASRTRLLVAHTWNRVLFRRIYWLGWTISAKRQFFLKVGQQALFGSVSETWNLFIRT